MKTSAVLILYGIVLIIPVISEIHPPHRIFETGSEAVANFSNTFLVADEIFTKTPVIDFTEKYASLPWDFFLDSTVEGGVFFNVNFEKKFRLGVSESITGSGHIKFSKELLELLANGNRDTPDGNNSANILVDARVYSDTSVSFMTFIKDTGIRLTPSLFLPLIYADTSTDPVIELIGDEKTGTTLHGKADMQVYTPFDSNSNIDFGCAGWDFSLYVEFPLGAKMDMGMEIKHIPLASANLRYSSMYSVEYTGHLAVSGLENNFESTLGESSENLNSVLIRRPVEFELLGISRPARWLSFFFSVGLLFEQPFSGYYEFITDIHAGNILGFSLATQFRDKVYSQRIGISLDLRVLEFDIFAASVSGNFQKSFQMAGIAVGAGVRFGI
ncbi:MAG: hypothetical protein LBS97_03050 [Treponema sp.]|jgi:hypothetical protein|nr:hypothetical protein [Treponema sp.]